MGAYEEILALEGAEGFKALAARLCTLAQERDKLVGGQISLPNYLFALPPGAGVSTQLRLMARLLEEKRLFAFEGEQSVFEWMLDAQAFEPEGRFDGLINEIECMAGFRSRFRGVIGLDIDSWVFKAERREFSRLIELARDTRGDILFVFIVRLRGEEKLADVVRRLSLAMPLEVVRCPLPDVRGMTRLVTGFLQARGVSVRPDAELEAFMAKLMDMRGFHGLRTLEQIADEAAYILCSGGFLGRRKVMGAQVVRLLSREGGCLQRMTEGAPARRMGFDEGRTGF